MTLLHEHFFVSSAAANYREPADVHKLAWAHEPLSDESVDWVRRTVVNCIDNLVMMDLPGPPSKRAARWSTRAARA